MTARKTTTSKAAQTTPEPPEAPTDEGTEFLRQFRACAGTGQFLTEVDGAWYLVTPTDSPGDEWINAQGGGPVTSTERP